VYADDILLLAPMITALEKLLNACERELTWLEVINIYSKINRLNKLCG